MGNELPCCAPEERAPKRHPFQKKVSAKDAITKTLEEQQRHQERILKFSKMKKNELNDIFASEREYGDLYRSPPAESHQQQSP
jgi:hypothetical protein|tara:strand:+ start:76 stop:324 length:249 start_codon:yes stop_codon:yes gene_type:complete